MIFHGTVQRVGKYWAIEIDELKINTQVTKREALAEMVQAAIADLSEIEVKDGSGVVICEEPGKKDFTVHFQNVKAMVPFILERLRFGTRLSLSDLSGRLGKGSRTTVSRYMSGDREPSISSFCELIEAMGHKVAIVKDELGQSVQHDAEDAAAQIKTGA